MKKIVFLVVFIVSGVFVCVAQVSRGSDSTAYYKQKYVNAVATIKQLEQRPVMTADQFVRLYNYDRLLKYYTICKRKPTQWKYYKGWSTRVFEQ